MLKDEYILARAIEQINKEFFEIKNSKEYSIGTKIQRLITAIKNKKIKDYFIKEYKFRKCARFNKKIPLGTFDYGKCNSNMKVAVYSCITGGYDNIIAPLIYPSNIDYILFTDDLNKDLKGWQVRQLPESACRYESNTLRNRYCKMHPEIVGIDYDFAIYVDGNICVYSDLTSMINVVNYETGLAFHRHNVRDCIYDEYEVLKITKRGNLHNLHKQIERYKNERFPTRYGLLEASVIVSSLKNNVTKLILNTWWNEFLKSESLRDQISLPYIIWKCGFTIDQIGDLGHDVRRNPKLRKIEHNL